MTKGKSRRQRFDEAIAGLEIAKSEFESLRDELQNWLDNMPENLQEGQKAEELQEAIDQLETILDSLDEVTSTDVMFPGMY